MKRRAGLSLLWSLAALKVLGAVIAYLFTEPPPWHHPQEISLLLVLAFTGAALLLLIGGRADLRAIYLGTSFLLLASLYANSLLLGLQQIVPPAGHDLIRSFKASAPDAFIPLFLWLFAASFPRLELRQRGRSLLKGAAVVAGALGVLLFAGNLLYPIAPGLPLQPLSRPDGVVFVLTLALVPTASLAVMLIRARKAHGTERRRVQLFVTALLLGFGPLLTQVLLEVSIPAYAELTRSPRVRFFLRFIIFGGLASVPFTTAYAVLVHRVLNVRLIARRALQYALARHSTLAATLVPFAALCTFVAVNRGKTVVQLFSGSELVVLVAATALGVVGLRYRGTVLEYVDRRFFRERYDARQLLTTLVDQIRSTSGRADLADLVANGIDRALHLERVAVLVTDPKQGLLRDPLGTVRPLDPSSRLATRVAASSTPLEVDLSAPASPVRELPETDRHWVGDGGFQLLVPLAGTDGSLLGILALGEKKSGLPFLGEDRQLLAAIAHTAAPILELQQLRRHPPAAGAETAARTEEPSPLPTATEALECLECGRLFLPATEGCNHCRRPLQQAKVPYVLPGKFRFESRLGSGGMSVVYLAVDLALGRPVAVKTLRRLSPEDALRLRREARTAAAVSHPNLAFIFGVETWYGTPMLILEYLEGGTLADRLLYHTFSAMETVELGLAMAGALERLHAADILHRDVKPSNIGYARDGTPKLMDFGIALATSDPRGGAPSPNPDSPDNSLEPTRLWSQMAITSASSQQLIGTLFYISPEALDGVRPSAAFDLWSLNLVLYECLAAERVFAGDNVRAIIRAIRSAGIPDIRHYRPDCPGVVSDYFARNLNRDPAQRAASATLLRRQLEEVRFKLMA